MLFKGKKSYVYVANLPAEISLTIGLRSKVRHRILTSEGNVVSNYDAKGHRMIITLSSNKPGKTNVIYKLEYPNW